MKDSHALRISLGPSRIASALVCASCLSSAALVAWLPGPATLRGAIVIGIAVYAIVTLRRWAARCVSSAIVGIEVDLDQSVCLIDRAGRRIVGVLQADSYVGALIATVVMRPDARRRLRSTTILPDMLPAEDFRRLRLLLRLGYDPATAAKPSPAPAASVDHR